MDIMSLLAECVGFDWDEGNIFKNWEKHRVSASECEQIFFNLPMVAVPDERHSHEEVRFYALGQTDSKRLLFVVFAVRNKLIRVISARDMNRNERKVYETS